MISSTTTRTQMLAPTKASRLALSWASHPDRKRFWMPGSTWPCAEAIGLNRRSVYEYRFATRLAMRNNGSSSQSCPVHEVQPKFPRGWFDEPAENVVIADRLPIFDGPENQVIRPVLLQLRNRSSENVRQHETVGPALPALPPRPFQQICGSKECILYLCHHCFPGHVKSFTLEKALQISSHGTNPRRRYNDLNKSARHVIDEAGNKPVWGQRGNRPQQGDVGCNRCPGIH